jgi:hypothetical protein
MTTNQDPVVRDLTAYINRSAGQHQRHLTLPVRDTMTDDRLNLHRVDTAQLGHDDGVSVGGCCTHECNEGRDCPQRIEFAGGEPVDWPFVAIVALILTVICVAAFSPEIAAFVYKISN